MASSPVAAHGWKFSLVAGAVALLSMGAIDSSCSEDPPPASAPQATAQATSSAPPAAASQPTTAPAPLRPSPASSPVAPPAAPQPPAPPPPPPAQNTCGAPANPWGYNFCGGNLIFTPPSNFCGYFACIKSFWTYTNGYVDQCNDGLYSHSGGVRGACSYHGGERRPLYSP